MEIGAGRADGAEARADDGGLVRATAVAVAVAGMDEMGIEGGAAGGGAAGGGIGGGGAAGPGEDQPSVRATHAAEAKSTTKKMP